MPNVASVSKEEIGELRRDLDRLKSDLSNVRSDLSHLSGDAFRTARAGATEARNRIEQGVRTAGAKTRESVEAAEHQVAEHPFIALASVFAVGIMVGFGLRQRF